MGGSLLAGVEAGAAGRWARAYGRTTNWTSVRDQTDALAHGSPL
jgi:hypothetical protein